MISLNLRATSFTFYHPSFEIPNRPPPQVWSTTPILQNLPIISFVTKCQIWYQGSPCKEPPRSIPNCWPSCSPTTVKFSLTANFYDKNWNKIFAGIPFPAPMRTIEPPTKFAINEKITTTSGDTRWWRYCSVTPRQRPASHKRLVYHTDMRNGQFEGRVTTSIKTSCEIVIFQP